MESTKLEPNNNYVFYMETTKTGINE